jgi:hypothetical protein
VARQACVALRAAAPCLAPDTAFQAAPARAAEVAVSQPPPTSSAAAALEGSARIDVLSALVRLLVAPPPAQLAPGWPSAAEAAIAAVYALSSNPAPLLSAVLEQLLASCWPGACILLIQCVCVCVRAGTHDRERGGCLHMGPSLNSRPCTRLSAAVRLSLYCSTARRRQYAYATARRPPARRAVD